MYCVGPWLGKTFPESSKEDTGAHRLRVYFGTPINDQRFTFPNLPSYNFPGVTGWAALPVDNRGFQRARRRARARRSGGRRRSGGPAGAAAPGGGNAAGQIPRRQTLRALPIPARRPRLVVVGAADVEAAEVEVRTA